MYSNALLTLIVTEEACEIQLIYIHLLICRVSRTINPRTTVAILTSKISTRGTQVLMQLFNDPFVISIIPCEGFHRSR